MFWFSYSKATSYLAVLLLASFMTPVPAAASDSDNSADVKVGKKLYSQTCVACHGGNGKGVLPGVSNFTAKDGPLAKTDAELVKSVTDGLATPGAALSMPAKGGNPSMTDVEIAALIAYLRAEFGGS
jgi:mono/diheme cytochrome c family protein